MGKDAKGAAGVLGEVLKRDKADLVREAAAVSLAGRLNDEAYTQVFTLAEAMKDPHAGTRSAAAEALKNMGEKAKPVLAQMNAVAQDPKADRFPRLFAIQTISRWGDDGSLKALVAIVEDKATPLAIRQEAVDGIGRMGDKGAPAVAILATCLGEKEVELRRAAAQALGQVGYKAQEAWPAIKMAYADMDNGVRNQVIRLAGSVGKVQKEAILLLAQAAEKDANLENRLAALQELGRLEDSALDAMPLLTRLAAEDVRAAVREAARAAVKRIKEAP